MISEREHCAWRKSWRTLIGDKGREVKRGQIAQGLRNRENEGFSLSYKQRETIKRFKAKEE